MTVHESVLHLYVRLSKPFSPVLVRLLVGLGTINFTYSAKLIQLPEVK